MFENKILIDPPFKIDKRFYMSPMEMLKESMRESANNTMIQNYSRFFLPGIVNIFTDAAKSNEVKNLAAIGNVITFMFNGQVYARLAANEFNDCDKIIKAELSAILYGLICYNENRVDCNEINVFTDSINSITMLRDIFHHMNTILGDSKATGGYLAMLNNKFVNNILVSDITEERSIIMCPVNLYHIKGHTKDLMSICTRFQQLNGFNISIQDAIELTNYNTLVNSKVNKYMRCPANIQSC